MTTEQMLLVLVGTLFTMLIAVIAFWVRAHIKHDEEQDEKAETHRDEDIRHFKEVEDRLHKHSGRMGASEGWIGIIRAKLGLISTDRKDSQ
jgi:hypothetical protein